MPNTAKVLLVVACLLSAVVVGYVRAVDKPAPPREVDKLTGLPGAVTKLTFALDGKSMVVETFFQPPPPKPGFGNGGGGNPGYPVVNHVAWTFSPRKTTTLRPLLYAYGGSLVAPDLRTMATWHSIGPDTQQHEYYDVAAALKGAKPPVVDVRKIGQPPAPHPKADRPRDWKWLEPTLEPLAFSPDGKVAAAKLSREGAVVLFDVARDKQIGRIALGGQEALESVPGVLFSDDGKLVAVPLINGGPVRICEVEGGKERSRVGKFVAGNMLALTPDGKRLALGNLRSGEVQVWDTATGKRSGTWQTGLRGVNDLNFSGDGKVLFAAGDRIILGWDSAAGKEIIRLRAHQAAVTVLVLSPDGQRLASGGKDKAVYLWDVSAHALRNQSRPQSPGEQKP